MNIHEHQAKDLIKKFGAPVSKGVVIFNLNEIDEKIKQLNSKMYVVKAQIHAGGRGKAGGVKLVKSIDELKQKCKDLLGKVLVTHQPGMRVTKGGSMCANCEYWVEKGNICNNKYWLQWHDGEAKIPYPADEYCCNWWLSK